MQRFVTRASFNGLTSCKQVALHSRTPSLNLQPLKLRASWFATTIYPDSVLKTCRIPREPYVRCFNASQVSNSQDPVSDAAYEKICEETLELLSDYFEELISSHSTDPDSDVSLSNGVLTVQLGSGKGTYIINKQTPNKQIWLSSPFSGPKRYDLIQHQWIYRHDNTSLHDLLNVEMSTLLNKVVHFPSLVPRS